MNPIHPKVVGATGATGFAAIVIAILTASGVTVSTDLTGAILSLSTLVGGFLTPSLKGEIGRALAPEAQFGEALVRRLEPVAQAAAPLAGEVAALTEMPPPDPAADAAPVAAATPVAAFVPPPQP